MGNSLEALFYGIFADNESVENGLFETEDGYVIQMTKVLDNE